MVLSRPRVVHQVRGAVLHMIHDKTVTVGVLPLGPITQIGFMKLQIGNMLGGNTRCNLQNFFSTLMWFDVAGVLISHIGFLYRVLGTSKNTLVWTEPAHYSDVLHLWGRAQLWAVVISLAESLYTDASELHLRWGSESQRIQYQQLEEDKMYISEGLELSVFLVEKQKLLLKAVTPTSVLFWFIYF